MSFAPGEAAIARARQTMAAAHVFAAHAVAIAATCQAARTGDTIVALVDRSHGFRGVWTVGTADVDSWLARMEQGGWSLIFAPQTSIATIRWRWDQLARLANHRAAAIRHRLDRQQ